MKPYRLLTPALNDLTQILEYFDENSVTAGSSFLEKLERRLCLLADFPESGHKRPEFGHDNFRYITFDSYVIVYEPAPARLPIVAIIHASRDVSAVLSRLP